MFLKNHVVDPLDANFIERGIKYIDKSRTAQHSKGSMTLIILKKDFV